MAQMKAKHGFRYAGRRLTAGESFDTRSDRDAMLLEAAGRAVRTNVRAEKDAKVAKRRGRPRKDAAVTEPVEHLPPEESAIVDELTDRFYQRRDMEAE